MFIITTAPYSPPQLIDAYVVVNGTQYYYQRNATDFDYLQYNLKFTPFQNLLFFQSTIYLLFHLLCLVPFFIIALEHITWRRIGDFSYQAIKNRTNSKIVDALFKKTTRVNLNSLEEKLLRNENNSNSNLSDSLSVSSDSAFSDTNSLDTELEVEAEIQQEEEKEYKEGNKVLVTLKYTLVNCFSSCLGM